MAEAVVKFAVYKIGNMISNEAQFLGGVKDQVEWAQTKLRDIQCYLKDADSKRTRNALAENWLNQLRDVAYRMEDAIDTFHLELDDKCKKDPCLLDKLKSYPTRVPGLHKLGKELDKIKLEFEEILKSKNDYGIDPLQDQDRGSGIVDLSKRREVYQDVNETEIVGLNAIIKDILDLLLIHEGTSTLPQKRKREQTSKRTVITIVGPGGLGKTTLAHMIYRYAKACFDFHMMLSVSQQFSRIDLLRKMLSELDDSILESCKDDVSDLIVNLKQLLSSKRYLIILDDVWDTIVWEQLKDALPDVENGSRVLMTSRDEKVAKSADHPRMSYKPKFLDDNESIELLLKKARQYQKPSERCPNDLYEIAVQLSKKCKGLPLALIVLGGILSLEEQTYSAWERVLRTMNWPDEGKDCMNVLNMSYHYMPYEAKQCFLYLALFPEDHEFCANRLIKMWIAEGFIPHKDKKTMEEIAKDYLEILFQRCMVQEARRTHNGLIKYFKVHDLIRELAIKLATEKKFHTVFPKAIGVNQSDGAYRRVLLESCGNEFMKYIGKMSQKTRSLILFGPEYNLPKFAEFRLLSVLEIVNVKWYKNKSTELKGLDRLIHLKYLGFKGCEGISIDWRRFSGRMKNLETLDLRGIILEDFMPPIDLWTIDALRHVYVDEVCAIPILPTEADYSNLQTLKWVSTSACCRSQLPHLINLLKLEVTTWGNDHKWDRVPHLLKNLPSLVSLHIRVNILTHNDRFIPENIVYPRELPNYSNLKTLELNGAWPEGVTLKANLLPPHLVKLSLADSNLRKDPMPELGKLKNLNKLELWDSVYIGEQMNCPAGFPVLQTLVLNVSDVEVLTVGNAVMPKLKNLTKSSCQLRLNMPPELKHFER